MTAGPAATYAALAQKYGISEDALNAPVFKFKKKYADRYRECAPHPPTVR